MSGGSPLTDVVERTRALVRDMESNNDPRISASRKRRMAAARLELQQLIRAGSLDLGAAVEVADLLRRALLLDLPTADPRPPVDLDQARRIRARSDRPDRPRSAFASEGRTPTGAMTDPVPVGTQPSPTDRGGRTPASGGDGADAWVETISTLEQIIRSRPFTAGELTRLHATEGALRELLGRVGATDAGTAMVAGDLLRRGLVLRLGRVATPSIGRGVDRGPRVSHRDAALPASEPRARGARPHPGTRPAAASEQPSSLPWRATPLVVPPPAVAPASQVGSSSPARTGTVGSPHVASDTRRVTEPRALTASFLALLRPPAGMPLVPLEDLPGAEADPAPVAGLGTSRLAPTVQPNAPAAGRVTGTPVEAARVDSSAPETVAVARAWSAPGQRVAPIVRATAAGALAVGIALTLFVGYAVYGTAITEGRAQRALSPATHLRIASPDIGLDALVLASDRRADLARGPGVVGGSGMPGAAAPVVLAGHRTTDGAPFRHLGALRIGSQVTLILGGKAFAYEVNTVRTSSPGATLQLSGTSQALVLVSGAPAYRDAQRIVVVAHLVGIGAQGVPARALRLPDVGGSPPDLAAALVALVMLGGLWAVRTTRRAALPRWARRGVWLPAAALTYISWVFLLGGMSSVL